MAKIELATALSVSSNYAGSVAGEITGKAFKEADTLRLGLIDALVDIDYQVSLRRIEYANGTTNYICGFTPQGAVTLDEKVLAPKKLKNELEICKEDLRQIWSSAQMGFSAHNDNMPADVESALLSEILADQAQYVDNLIWNGDASNDGEFDGFVKAFNADGAIVKPTPSGVAIDESNVEDELKKVLAAIPIEIRREDLKVVVSPDVFQAYTFYLVSKGIATNADATEKTAQFGKYMLTEVNGLDTNTIIAYEMKNLKFGTGLMSDHNEIRIKDMDESDLSGQVRYKQVYTAGVQYINSEDIVYYKSV